jgi:uncharacterized protein
MYSNGTDEFFIVDDHVHAWDARPTNWVNEYGKGFIECMNNAQLSLTPAHALRSLAQVQHQSDEQIVSDLFVDGHVDVAIFQSTILKEFYVEGFNTLERYGRLRDANPGRFVINGHFDPRDEEAGLDVLSANAEEYDFKGVKLYTAEWRGESKGWKLTDPWSLKYLEHCERLGIRNIHIHKGPTIYPLNMDAFDVGDVDEVATAFPNLNFIIEHLGMPRLDQFCWIAGQEPNVYGGISAILPFIKRRPRYWAEIMGELLYWLGEDRILFGSDYGQFTPRWQIESFADFTMPADLAEEYGELTTTAKKKILGLNTAKLYDIAVPDRYRLAAGEVATDVVGSAVAR